MHINAFKIPRQYSKCLGVVWGDQAKSSPGFLSYENVCVDT